MSQFGSQGGSFGPNAWLVDDMYDRFLADPDSVSESWREFFADYRPAPVPAPQPPTQSQVAAPAAPVPAVSGASKPGLAAPVPVAPAAAAPVRGGPREGRGHPAARRGVTHRRQHGSQLGRAHRDECADGAGPAPRSQPPHPEQPAGSDHGGQGQLHAHHRLRRRARPAGRARAELRLRARRRREGQAGRHSPQARGTGPGGRPGEERRQPHAARAVHQGCRCARLPLLRPGLRRPRPQNPHQQDRPGRLRRHDGVPDQPRDARHGAVGAAPDAGARRHHRRRGARLPGRLRGGRPACPGPVGPRQGRHAHLHLRPPHHSGCRVGPLPRAGRRPDHRCRRVLRRPVRVDGRAVRARPLAGRQQRRRRERGGGAPAPGQAGPCADPHQHVPRARPSHRPPRPPGRRASAHPPRARPVDLRVDHLGSAAPVRRRRPRRARRRHARRNPARPARRLLPHARHRVHAHSGPRAEALDPTACRGSAHEPQRGGATAHPREAQRGRGLRALPPHPLRRAEAVRPRRSRVDHRPARRAARRRRGLRRRRGRDGHGTPWPPQRPGQHCGQVVSRNLRGVRGQPRSRLGPGFRRREVPQGRPRRLPRQRRRGAPHHPCLQPLAPRGGGPGGRGHDPGEAGQDLPTHRRHTGRGGRRRRRVPLHVCSRPRRRGVRRSGCRGRDAQPVRALGLPHGRHRARRDQQPARLHHGAGVGPHLGVPDGRGEDGAGPHLPRERR